MHAGKAKFRIDTHRVDCAHGVAADLCVVRPQKARGPAIYWLPAMGVAARHYLPLARALAVKGIPVALHEWRGIGSSNVRAGRRRDWSYRHLLNEDLHRGIEVACEHGLGRRWVLGGHSLGGQLAALYAALTDEPLSGLVLVGSGTPHWRRFPGAWGVGLRAAFTLAPALAHVRGHFPGRRLGFAGREARGVIADWARSGRSGRYAPSGMPRDLDQRLARVDLPVLALHLADDPFGPASSLQGLLGKLRAAKATVRTLATDALGVRADHFSWMREPKPVADEMCIWLDMLARNP